MARSDYEESPRSSRRSRNTSRNIPPPAPEVDWSAPVDEEAASPRRRRRTETDRDRSRHSDWERRHDEEVLLRTPESRASSSSYHHSHRRYYDSGSRRDRSTTPSQSVASSMTSVLTPHPPRSSVTRPSNAVYRRPSVSIRDASPAAYDDEGARESRRSLSQPRSIPVLPSTPLSRRTSRMLRSASVSSLGSDRDNIEEPYDDSHDDEREDRSRRETRLVRVERVESSRSRANFNSRDHGRRKRYERSIGPDEDDRDETDSRHPPSIDDRPSVRAPSRPVSRSRSRPASVRHVPARDSDHEHDADSEEPPTHDLRDRFERRKSRKPRQGSSAARDHGRSRSESHFKRSPPPKRYVLSSALLGVGPGSSHRPRASKRYYESEVTTVERLDRRHPPSASHRRSQTVVDSGSVAASQHQSVSSSTRRSSTFLGSFFRSSLPGYSHQHSPEKPVKLYACVVCLDDELPARKTAKLKCGHRMCNSCLKRSFKLSITDPQHMPPTCCNADPVPLKHVERLFDINFKKTWNKKFAEFTARNRIYCPRRSCGEFIRPEHVHRTSDGRKYGKCSSCATKVCVQCNGKWHRERDCPKDEETVRLLAQAKEEGWQRCYKCRVLVELQEGCNHMTCRCGAEFCYVCGDKWKSCSCPWFNYETVENDRLQHMQIPVPVRERFGARPTVDLPPSPQRESRPVLRTRPQNYEEELLFRRLQEEQDEAYARRLSNYRDYDDEREDDFLHSFGDINGIGNAGGHFMNEDFRPRPRTVMVPQPPPAPHPPPIPLEPAPIFERAQTGDYIQGVNRARGVRANSLTRLADRFNSDLRSGPAQHRVPPTLQTAVTMPLPAMTPALAPGPQIRRHTVEEIGTRSVERPSGRITRPVVYDEPEDMAPQGGGGTAVRKQHVREPPRGPKQSAMAGLTGDGRYHGRVDEWLVYVGQGQGQPAEVASSG